jgi:branched-chain amino acid transport system substrate-binding protein
VMAKYRPMPPSHLLGGSPYIAPRYSFDSFEGFLNAKLLVEILQQADRLQAPLPERDRPDTEKIIALREQIPQAAATVQAFDLGIDTPVSFSQGSNQALNKVYYTKISNGRFVSIQDWEQWTDPQ